MNKQNKGLNRNTLDKYYTKDSTVNLCLNLVKKYLVIEKNDLCIEPGAGNGSFISGIKSLFDKYIFYDLEPEHKEIIKKDYLKCDYKDVILDTLRDKDPAVARHDPGITELDGGNISSIIEEMRSLEIDKLGQNIHIIGNPPFGRQSSLAIKFIKKSCEFCNSISFILPKSFKKDSLKKTFPLNFHLIIERDLPDNSFLVNGIEYNVPCIFQIWKKNTYNRDILEKLEPSNFIFVKKTDDPDISFRRVGVNAGIIDTNIESKSIQSHYFIKFTNKKSIAHNIRQLSKIKYDFNNTVGPNSISKQELIAKFNIVL
jgi:predicted RNA methylase